MPDRPDSVILVYDGDSGVAAMLLDVVKKAVGREECPLCEITYSPVGKRGSWVACEKRLGIEVKELHRDQLPADWNIARTDLPCILARVRDERPSVLVPRAEIVACKGSVEALERKLLDHLSPGSAPP
jgi:hypothetical protein